MCEEGRPAASAIADGAGIRVWTASDTRLRRQRQCQSIWQLGLFFELLNELDRHHDLGLSFDPSMAEAADDITRRGA